MTGTGLLYVNSSTVAGADGVWIAVGDVDGMLLAHEQLVAHPDAEFVNLLAVKLAAGLLAYPYLGVSRGVIVTDSTQAVGAVHAQRGEPPRTETARRRAGRAGPASCRRGLGVAAAVIDVDAEEDSVHDLLAGDGEAAVF